MPDFLPLCSSRQDLLPTACRSCAWWLSSGVPPSGKDPAYARRREWTSSLELTWGCTGLIFPADGHGRNPSSVMAVASIQYAPVSAVPRLRDLPLGPLPPEATLVFCLRQENGSDRPTIRRLLQKALIQLRSRGAREVFAYAAVAGGAVAGDHCEFFAPGFLEDAGFKLVRDNGDLFLMRADLGGLASVLGQIESAVMKVLRNDPTPSPAAWIHLEKTR